MLINKKGITLIALIITIIVLLILAAVTINIVLGDNGLFNKAKIGVEKYKEESLYEEVELALSEIKMEMLSNKTSSNMADYVIQKEKIATEKGEVYVEEEEYYYKNNNGNIIRLLNEEGTLIIDRSYNGGKPAFKGTTITFNANGGENLTEDIMLVPKNKKIRYCWKPTNSN